MIRSALAVAVLAGLALLAHRALFPQVMDPDSFYHLKHAWLYRTCGLFETDFPWTQFSAIRRESADLWYGFHVLLLPLTTFADLVTGVRAAAFLVTVTALLLVYAAFTRLAVRPPLLWTLVFAVMADDLLLRLMMVRPHPLSLGLFLLLFALLMPERGARATATTAIATVCALVAWLHLSLAWVPVAILLVTGGAALARGYAVPWQQAAAVLAGLGAGFLLRPHPLGAGRLAWIQVSKLLAVKHLPLRLGAELLPFTLADFVQRLLPISVLTGLAAALFALLAARGTLTRAAGAAGAASLALAGGFFVLTFTTARRSSELFVAFAVTFAGLVWTAWREADGPVRRAFAVRAGVGAAALAVIAAAVLVPLRFRGYANSGVFPDVGRDVAAWLGQHARSGEIVFNVQWERFPLLFFRNHANYYVNGMDPIFAYDYDPTLYWKHHHLAAGASAATCGAPRCTADNAEDTHRVLARDFHASYVLVDRHLFRQLYAYLAGTPGFEKVYESRGSDLLRLPSGEPVAAVRGDSLFRVVEQGAAR